MRLSPSLVLGFATSVVVEVLCGPTRGPETPPQLNTIAKGRNKLYFGSATNGDELTDPSYLPLINNNRMFGQITPRHAMKWNDTEPSPGVFTFAKAEQIAQLAKTNKQILRGHNCVWHQSLPDWVANGTFTEPELIQIVENHCGTLVGHFRGQVSGNDELKKATTEVIDDDGTFRQDVFFNTTGTRYISAAFHAARKADPHAKLYANEFNIEGPGPKSSAYLKFIKALKQEGVPIDGLGIQSHLIVGQLPPNITETLAAFTELGIEIALTELDIRMPLPATQEMIAQQRKDYETIVSACNALKGCIGVTVWDFTDKYSWIPGTFPGEGAACPWDENFEEKPAFFGIVDGFRGA